MPPTMEFNLTPVNPNGRPRNEVRITSISALPYGDGRRIHLRVVLTPFQERPTLHVEVISPSGRVAGSLSVIVSEGHDIELTVHVRGEVEPGLTRGQAVLQSGEDPPQDTAETTLKIAPPSSYY